MVRRLCSVACLLILAVFTLSCAGNSPADEVQIDEPVPELPSDGDTRVDPGETGTAITESVFGVAEVGNQGDTEPVDRSLEERIQINGAVARLDDPLWSVRRNAIGTLIDLDARETSEAVGRRLRDENAAVRQSAIDALRAFGAGEYTSDIADFLDSDIDSIRLATVRALSAFGARQHLERMRALENDPDDRVRFTVSQFLAKWDGYDERVAAWIQQLGDADPDVRRAVLGPIDLQNYPELAGNVAQLFSDPDPRTRTSAIAQFVSSRESREEFFDQIA